ncbi:hypothetical protein Tco_0749969 [Tanacetum coccineum]|uniref:Uncharacterized protein n=1 Tax=Tanacetum coccineum TaxID=301880 RepID=A0ABQ4YZX4_9ASTR
MDDPYITMEEYIRLEEERAQSHGETFNWQTAPFEKVRNYNEEECFTDFEAEFPAIVLGNINAVPSQSPEIPYCESTQGMTMGEYEAEKEDSEIEFPAIVLDNMSTSDTTLSYEPMVSPLNESEINFRILFDESEDEEYTLIFDENSFSYKIIYVDYLKTDSENDSNKVNLPSSPEPTISYFNDLDFFKEFINEFPVIVFNDNLTSKLAEPSISPPHIDELKIETSLSELDKFKRYNTINVETNGSHEPLKTSHKKFRKTFNVRSFINGLYVNTMTWNYLNNGMLLILIENLYVLIGIRFDPKRMSDTEMGLDVANTICFQLGGTRSERFVPDKGDLRDYWIEISSDRDFLGAAPFYVHIRDPVRRLCHRMIACTISGKGQGPEKVTGVDLFYLRSMNRGTANVPYLLAQYMFRHAEGRKSGARLSGGHFIRRLADHFGLGSDEGLRGLFVISQELLAWVAPGPERQPDAAVGAHKAAKDAPANNEVAQADPAPAQAHPPPPAPQPRTMSQRIERIEEEMSELQQNVVGLREVVESSITEQTGVSTWMISCMTQLMDTSSRTYQAFDSTLVGSSRFPYQRRTHRRTDDASTSAAPHTDDQPNP